MAPVHHHHHSSIESWHEAFQVEYLWSKGLSKFTDVFLVWNVWLIYTATLQRTLIFLWFQCVRPTHGTAGNRCSPHVTVWNIVLDLRGMNRTNWGGMQHEGNCFENRQVNNSVATYKSTLGCPISDSQSQTQLPRRAWWSTGSWYYFCSPSKTAKWELSSAL